MAADSQAMADVFEPELDEDTEETLNYVSHSVTRR